jgi:hypothetical protein
LRGGGLVRHWRRFPGVQSAFCAAHLTRRPI